MENLSDRRFKHVKVVAFSHKNPQRDYFWHCRCDCGFMFLATRRNLVSGNTNSCGCFHGIHVDNPITLKQLKRLLKYESRTGLFRWRVEGRNYLPGDVAGHAGRTNPYVRINLGRKSYYGQILAYFYRMGRWPKKKMDHENGDKHDNRWSNLRPANDVQNTGNAKKNKRNTTGFRGVSFRRGRFRAKIAQVELGAYIDAIEAAKVYDRAALKKFGEFARTNFPT